MNGQRRRWGVVLSYANAVVSLVVGLLYVPILLRGIGQDEYGIYQLVGSMLGYINILNGILSAGTTRYYCTAFASGDEKRMQSVLATCRYMYRWLSLVIVVAAGAIILAIPSIYQNSLTSFQLLECQLMLATLVVNLIVTMMNSVYVAVINANEHFVFLKGTTLVNSIVQPIAVIAIIRFAPYAISITFVMLILNIIIAIIQNHYAKAGLNGSITQRAIDKSLLRSIVVFVAGLMLASVADQIFWRTNQLVLGYYFGAAVVAIYGVGAQIYTSYLSLGNVITSVFLPRISELCAHGRMDLVSALFVKVGRLSLYVLLGIYGGFVVFGKDFITLWAGAGYLDAYYVALAIMTAFMLDSSQSLGITILQVLNKYRFRAILYFAFSFIDVVLVILLAPSVGSVGCAVISAAIMMAANGPIMNVYYSKVVKLDIATFWKNAARLALPLLVATVIFYFAWAMLPAVCGWVQIIIGGMAYLLVFLVVALVFSANEYEKSLVKSLVAKLWR